ncbi:MAG: PAS domain S-box protein, partial [Halolamina sp.]
MDIGDAQRPLLVVATADGPVTDLRSLADATERFAETKRLSGLDPANSDRTSDCVVVVGPSAGDGLLDAVRTARRANPDRPVVAVVGEGVDPTAALAAGATTTVPATTVASDPRTVLNGIAPSRRPLTDGGVPNQGDTAMSEMLEALPDLVAVVDPETGEILRVNRQYVEFYGHDRAELRERGFAGMAAPGHDGETPAEALGEAREGKGPVTVEWPVTTGEGERRWLATRLTRTVVDGDERIVTCERDVTERKDEQVDVERAMARTDVATSFHDPETGALREASHGLAESLGYEDRSALLSAGLDALAPVEADRSVDALCELVRRVDDQMTLETTEWTTAHTDDEQRRYRLSFTPGSLNGERVVLCRWADVTERQNLERSYREVFEGVSDGLVVHEPETGRIVDVNDRYCEMMGYDRDELVGATVGLITSPEADITYDRARERIQQASEEGPQLFEWPAYTADGNAFPAEVHLSLVEIRGTERVLASVRDVTERKRRQREYEQIFDGVNDAVTVHDPWNEEMVDANETVCDLVGYDRETVLAGDIAGISAGTHGFTEARAYEIQREVAETGDPRTVEWRVETAEGKRRLLETNVTPATVGGEQRVLVLSRDITERRRRRRQLEAIVERIDEAVALWEDAAEVSQPAYLSPAIEEIAGIPHGELAADITRFRERIHPEDRGETAADRDAMFDDVAAGDAADRYDFEFRYRRPDGETRWIHLTAYPLPESDRYGRVTVFDDVTERKRRQREYEQIFDAVIDGITVHDPETGEIVDTNEAMTDLVGYDQAEILERGIEGLSPTDEGYTAEKGLEIIQRVMERDEPEVVDWAAETSDGERRWLEVKATPAVIGGEDRYVAIDRDITERKRREQKLERTRKQFRQIADAVDEVIHLAAPDFSETYYLSPGAEDIWGRPVAEMDEDPRAFEAALHPEDRKEHMAFLNRVSDELTDPEARGDAVYSYDYRVRREDGEVRWVDGRLYPIRDEDGEVIRVVSMSRDTTERRRRQQSLQSFQAATAELTTADSTTDACRTAVAAATEVFDFDSVAVHLFDDERGRLEPTAATDSVGPVEDLPAWGSDDRIPWEAFVDERPIWTGVSEAPSVAVGSSGSVLVMPLAGHGVITVWTDGSDAADETTHLVAATLEGALNHLVGRRRLESQREELEAQTERAEQMERVAELTRRVEAAITGQSHRIGVERAVCERLVDIDPFVAAWTAEVEPGADRLTPRTTAGIARERAEQAPTGDGRDTHPAQHAWQTGELAVESDLVGGGGWRRELLRRGVQAVCAIPLAYEGITHGVLVVHATTPGAFDGAARETLAQLGISIGNAITAIERRRALESDETIELEFRADGAPVPFARLAGATDCQVRHDRTVRRQDGSISVVYTVIGDIPDDVDRIAERTLPGDVEVIGRSDDEVVVERSGTMWFGSILSENGGILRRGHATPDRTTLVVERPTETNTRRFVERLEETIPELDLFAQRQHRPADTTPSEVGGQLEHSLSERQLEALETA